MKPTLLERYTCKTRRVGECLEWTASLRRNGYGVIGVKGKLRSAHRVAWELAHQQLIPAGLLVMHTCDNRRCVDPTHLQLGTVADNMRDMAQKNRSTRCHPNRPRGESVPNAKLNADAVREIRTRRAAGESISSIARAFMVSRPTIARAVLRTGWAHVA